MTDWISSHLAEIVFEQIVCALLRRCLCRVAPSLRHGFTRLQRLSR